MQRIGDEYPATDASGNAIPNATVTIVDADTSVVAVCYDPDEGNTPTTIVANPLLTDALGRWRVALPDGRYTITISGGGITPYTIPRVCVFDNTVTYPSPMLGTVTSVALAMPAGWVVSNSPVTGVGTLTVSYGSWGVSELLIAPVGGGTPTLRKLVLADLPVHGPAAATYGSATKTVTLTVNSQGIVTGVSEQTCTPAWSSISGKPTSQGSGGYGIVDGVNCIFVQTATASFGNTTAETTIIGSGAGSLTIDANSLRVGSVIRIRALGTIGALTTTLRMKMKLGASIVADSTALSYSVAVATPFELDMTFTVRSLGASATGVWAIRLDAGTVFNAGFAGAVTTFDSTVSNAIDVTAQYGTANTTNIVVTSVTQVFVEA